MNHTSSTATTNGASFTFEKLYEVCKAIESMPEPFAAYMRKHGCPPEQWDMVVPKSVLDGAGNTGFLPSYVKVSPWVDRAVFIKKGLLL
jgi:hypothetical protein